MAYASQTWTKNLLGQTLKSAQEQGLIGSGGSSVGNAYILSNEYSEDEKVVGKWIDGRPIYRKVIKTNSPSSISTNTIVATLDTNIDNVTKLEGYTKNDNSFINTSFYINSNSYLSIWFRYDTKQIMMYCANSAHSNNPTNIIIEYTKTTDAENSFTTDMIEGMSTIGNLTATNSEVDSVLV